jgi:hypothetical protein
MRTAAGPADRILSELRQAGRDPVTLWSAFVLVHLWLVLVNLILDGGNPIADVSSVYRYWVDRALVEGHWVGIDGPFVYPILALVPMLASGALYPLAQAVPGLGGLAEGWTLFTVTWLVIVTLLDAAALLALTGRRRRGGQDGTGDTRRRAGLRAAWWWVLFLLVLGPIAVSRIDAITVPVAVVAVTLVASRPAVASLLLTIAAWMKVWPGVIVMALVVVSKARMRVVVAGAAVSAVVLGGALSLGAGLNALSFVTEQTGRGLQVEAPISTVWMWQAWAGVPGTRVYFDTDILTWQVDGRGVVAAGDVMTPLLVLVTLAVTTLAVVLVRRGALASAILPPLVLALLAGLIAFQKVGSPQFISWLAVPVVLGIVTRGIGAGPSFRTPALLVLLVAALTQVVYPVLYGELLRLDWGMLVALSARNLLLIVLFGVAVAGLLRAARWRPEGMPPAAVRATVGVPASRSLQED